MASAQPLPQRGSATSAASTRPARAPARPRRAAGISLRAVPARRPLHRGIRVLLILTAVTITAIGILGTVALNALAAEASFEARTLERDIAELTLQRDDLIAAVAALESPERVRDVAIAQLGLLEPEVPGFLVVSPDDMPAAAPKPLIRLGE